MEGWRSRGNEIKIKRDEKVPLNKLQVGTKVIGGNARWRRTEQSGVFGLPLQQMIFVVFRVLCLKILLRVDS